MRWLGQYHYMAVHPKGAKVNADTATVRVFRHGGFSWIYTEVDDTYRGLGATNHYARQIEGRPVYDFTESIEGYREFTIIDENGAKYGPYKGIDAAMAAYITMYG